MKVMCVNNKNHFNSHVPFIEVGEIVTVSDSKKHDGEYWYQFIEYPSQRIGFQNHIYWYDAASFATLPSTSEEIAVECEQEAIIYQR